MAKVSVVLVCALVALCAGRSIPNQRATTLDSVIQLLDLGTPGLGTVTIGPLSLTASVNVTAGFYWNATASSNYAQSSGICAAGASCPVSRLDDIVQAGVAACTQCVLGSTYQQSDCTVEANRVCAPCTAGNFGQYLVSACTLTADAVWKNCTAECAEGTYETVQCTSSSDRVCKACTTRAGNQYRTLTCMPNIITAAGIKLPGRDAKYEACAECQSGVTYEVSACGAANSDACGGESNRGCATCSTCALGEFTATACTTTANTVCAQCAAVENSSFKAAGSCEFACNGGFYKSGQACGACAACDGNSYQVTACGAETNAVCSVKGALGLITSIDHQDLATPGRINFASLPFTFSNPLVFIGPPSHNGPDACVARIKSNGSGFKVWLAEAKNHDVWHTTESTSWLAIQSGQSTEGYSAGTLTIKGSDGWKTVTLPAELGARPWVFQMVQSANNNADPNLQGQPNNLRGYVKTRMSLASNLGSSFKLLLQSCEGCAQPAEETVAYLAVNSGCSKGATDDNDATMPGSCPNKVGSITLGGKTYDTVTGVVRTVAGQQIVQTVTFGRTFKEKPVVLANMQTQHGPNPSELRSVDVTTTQFKFIIDEDTNQDSERTHIEELVAFFAVGTFA